MSRPPEIESRAPLLHVEGLRKSYARPEGEVAVLKGIDLELAAGESLAVVGVSGAGKSTLLHLLGALDMPSAGRVALDGQDLNRLDRAALARVRNQKVGFVFQFHHLLPEFNTLENTMMPGLIAGLGRNEAASRAEKILHELGLSHRLTHRTGELSGGEQQRVAVARAMLLAPRLILADEPTGNLDAATGQVVEDLLLDVNRNRGVTLVVVTHNEALAGRMHRRIRLWDGKVVDGG